MAVVAMAVLGALVTGVFFAAMRDQRDGRDAVSRVQALAAAEYGLELTIAPASWRSRWNTAHARGLLATLPVDLGAESSDTVELWKLTSSSFLIVSAGAAGPAISRARRRVSYLIALQLPRPALRGVVAALDGVAISDSSSISGIDSEPADPDCPSAAAALPAVAVPSESLVDDEGCTARPCLLGATPVTVDSSTADLTMYEQFGERSRASVAASAVQLLAEVELVAPAPTLDAAGECQSSDPRNLGDPALLLGAASPCSEYFPVLHAPGNMRVEGGTGQGFLLVDGDLTIGAAARFHGVVSVSGVLTVTDGAELRGLALASRVVVEKGSNVSYSSCAASLALRAAGVPVVPPGQAWSELY